MKEEALVLIQPNSEPDHSIWLLSCAKSLPSTGKAVVRVAPVRVSICTRAQRSTHRWWDSRWDKLSHDMPFCPNFDSYIRDQPPDALEALVS